MYVETECPVCERALVIMNSIVNELRGAGYDIEYEVNWVIHGEMPWIVELVGRRMGSLIYPMTVIEDEVILGCDYAEHAYETKYFKDVLDTIKRKLGK